MSCAFVLEKINIHGEKYLLLPCYALIVITVVFEVLRRFFLSYSSIWGEEIARYAFIYVAWVAMSACIKDRTHIRLDILTHILPERCKAFIAVLGDILMFIMACIAFYWSIEPVLTSIEYGSVTDGLRVSKAWFLLSVPLGFFMALFRIIQISIEDWHSFYHNRPLKQAKQLFD